MALRFVQEHLNLANNLELIILFRAFGERAACLKSGKDNSLTHMMLKRSKKGRVEKQSLFILPFLSLSKYSKRYLVHATASEPFEIQSNINITKIFQFFNNNVPVFYYIRKIIY